MKLSEISDEVLAGMIRSGCYAKDAVLDGIDSKYLIVLAVPYGGRDGVEGLEDALEAFFDLVQDGDYDQRNLQVLERTETGIEVYEVSQESLQANRG